MRGTNISSPIHIAGAPLSMLLLLLLLLSSIYSCGSSPSHHGHTTQTLTDRIYLCPS